MTSPPPDQHDAILERVRMMMQFTPQGRALGAELVRVGPSRAWGKAPYREELVGDPETGVIAGGVLTTFLDQICGVAVILSMQDPRPIATLDLRIDYMRAAAPGRDILAEAHCYKIGQTIAFVRATAYEDTPEDP
ncbi:MAG: PaaI family thioesterase, partial [Hyphomonadaceae bacterium]|nr:PaaI family thioesterase [Hyphomonadaceae bacterium]